MMKKSIYYIIIFGILLILLGCEEQEQKEEEGNQELQYEGCTDTEGNVSGSLNQDFRTKGTVTSNYEVEHVSASVNRVFFGQKTDSCDKYEGLIEYGCAWDFINAGTAETHYITCSDVVGEGYSCKDGACVREKGQETKVIADCGGSYSVTLGVPFIFDGTKSQGDIAYYEVIFSDMSSIETIRANVTDSTEILLEYTFQERSTVDSVILQVEDSTGTKDYCEVLFVISG